MKGTLRRLIFIMLMFTAAFGLYAVPAHADDIEPLTVLTEPKDVLLDYPEGCIFKCEVSDPERIESYQWIITDGRQTFVLEGKSARTDTLMIPSSEQLDPTLYVRCEMTDTDGNELVFDAGSISVANRDEDRTVLYVGEWAIQPGEAIDLAEKGLGSGKVTFDPDGVHITLDSVQFDTDGFIYDQTLANSTGLMLWKRGDKELEYHVRIVGDCTFINRYFDPEYNSGGAVLNTFFSIADDEEPPTVIFEVDGTLTIIGGSDCIHSDGNVEIDAHLITKDFEGHYNDAITCRNLIVDEGAQLDITSRGNGMRCTGDMRVFKGAVIDITSTAPHVSVGPTIKAIVDVHGSLYMTDASMTVKGIADPERFVPYGSYLVNYSGIRTYGNVDLKGSSVEIRFEVGDSEEPFAVYLYGIDGEGDFTALMLSGSSMDIRMDVPNAYNACGVVAGGLVELEEGSTLNINVSAMREVAGLETEGTVRVADSSLVSSVSSKSDEASILGLAASSFEFDLPRTVHMVRSVANNGLAFAADTGGRGEEEVGPAEGYEPVKFTFGEDTVVRLPEDAVINLAGTPGFGYVMTVETFYSSSDMTRPCSDVTIANVNTSSSSDEGIGPRAVLFACLAAAALTGCALLLRKKKPAEPKAE